MDLYKELWALEKEQGVTGLRMFRKEPPQAFKDLMEKQAATFHAVSGVRWIGSALVADWCSGKGTLSYSSLDAMLEGLEEGYKLALGPTKPYSITYTICDLKPAYKGKTEEEVYRMLDLDMRYEKLPDDIFKKPKTVVENFATGEEASNRADELFDSERFPAATLVTERRIEYNQDEASWF